MASWLLDTLNFAVRWVHLITGIAWIGSSFYFVWLDNHLLRPSDGAAGGKGVGGELWSVHGGGFYHSQKYPVSPPQLPPTLHWFYWEAYSTFLSGTFLLVVQYFVQARTFLIDPAVADLTPFGAIAAVLGLAAATWIAYDLLCRSPLARRPRSLGTAVAGLGIALAFTLCALFSGRAAFLLFGAIVGTVMVANVFFVIIPGQRRVVASLRAAATPDPEDGRRGKLRSVHNTYFTLPVLFAMLSNHYAFLFGARHNAVVLVAMSAAGALIRHWFVARHKAHERDGRTPAWPAVAGVALIVATLLAIVPRNAPAIARSEASPLAPFDRAQQIIAMRCVGCHARKPTQLGFPAPPKGIVLETPDDVRRQLPQIAQQLRTRAMPIGNLTGMTDDERASLLDWVDHGAPR